MSTKLDNFNDAYLSMIEEGVVNESFAKSMGFGAGMGAAIGASIPYDSTGVGILFGMLVGAGMGAITELALKLTSSFDDRDVDTADKADIDMIIEKMKDKSCSVEDAEELGRLLRKYDLNLNAIASKDSYQ